jgi:microcystin degradation protein MlrC
MWRSTAVQLCVDAGIGSRLWLSIGGKVDPESGAPLDVQDEVLALVRQHHQQVGALQAPLGTAAAIRFAGIEVVLCRIRDQAYDPILLDGLGVDCRRRHFIVLKSSQQFHLGFDAVSKFDVALRRPPRGAAGLLPVRRPLWPLDE